ncbi:MAG: hypothetical protein ACYTF1_14985 [Planctomycetota bacterium]|jgi:hypothetical protein
MKRVTLTSLGLVAMLATAASAEYLPTMPPGSGIFGTVISASASFNDGYHWDNPGTPQDERDIVGHYLMPSAMPGYTAGDALDYHWVWVGRLGDHVTWDMGQAVLGVRVYPSQDHGPYTGPYSEFDEYRVWGSNDMTTWIEATEIALYCDDINNVRTHDGVKDYEFAAPYRYCRITSWIDSDFELDAVEVLGVKPDLDILPSDCPNLFTVNKKGKGRIPMAILGTEDFDVSDIDTGSISIADVVFPQKTPSIKDESAPVDEDECACQVGTDGIDDLVVHFSRHDLIVALGLEAMVPGTEVPITVTGELLDGTPFEATDCVTLEARED